jgi:recombination protein RecT
MPTEKRGNLTSAVTTQANGGGAVQASKPASLKDYLATPNIQTRFNEVLKDRAPQFMSSLINLVNSDDNLKVAEPMSVISSAMVAAALDLPVDKNLGYMWIIGRKDHKRGGLTFASPQLGYKGYVQLALRSGQYKFMNVIPVHEGELVSWNPLTEELKLDFEQKKSDAVIGYAGYFELLNGFKKSVYWTQADIKKHKERFSKTDKLWNSDWDAMSLKTVLKAMLSKWGILSIQMQKAFTEDEPEEERQVIDGGELQAWEPEQQNHDPETGEIIEMEQGQE